MTWWQWLLVVVMFLLGAFLMLSIPLAVQEFSLDRAARRRKKEAPIDWTGDHNLKIPVAPYFDPRMDFTEEEAFMDLVEENARLLKKLEDANELHAEITHQEKLKQRYLRELNRAKNRG